MAPRGTRRRDIRVRKSFRLYRAALALTRILPRAAARSGRRPRSGLLLVLDVADDVGDVLVAFLLLLDEGSVVHALVLELDLFLGALGCLALGRLLALGLRVSLLERNELGLGGLRRHHLFLRRGRRGACRGGGLRPCPRRRHRRQRHHGVALRADDRVLVQVVEFRAAIAAEALGAELGFRHGPGSLSGSKMRCFTWRVAVPVSIAPERLPRACSAAPFSLRMTTNGPRASVPVPTFVSICSTHFYERRNQRDTSNSLILVPLLNPPFAIAFAARCARTSGSGH